MSLSRSHATEASSADIQHPRAPELDSSKCVSCGLCVEVCPLAVFAEGDDGTYRVQHPGRCIECGACELNCQGNAIIFEPFPGCGCIWNATFRRLRAFAFWRKSKRGSLASSCCTD